MTNQQVIDKAVAWAVSIANSPSHGYDQADRWGPDYDCSSFVISAWQNAGVPVKDEGASYTGNMYYPFLRCGFKDVTAKVNLKTGAGLEKGDVLLNKANHTEMYVGGNQNVKASINEKGGVTGGASGDQSGREIYIGNYYNYPWNYVLRYEGGDSVPQTPKEEPNGETAIRITVDLPELKNGDKGEAVKLMQTLLQFHGLRYKCGWYGADGDFGPATQSALEKFQKDKGLVVDSICGEKTWKALLQV